MEMLGYWCLFTFLFSMFVLNVVFCGNRFLSIDDTGNHHFNEFKHSNDGGFDDFLLDTGKILKRDKRYLLWTGGGISKVYKGDKFIQTVTNYILTKSVFLFLFSFFLDCFGFLGTGRNT